MKKQNGITLVSLVITIIVMLILAGISLSMVMGENSVLEQAKTAVDETENGEEIERTELAVLGSYGSNGKYDSNKAFEGIKKNYNLTSATTTTTASGAKVVTGVNSKTGENITLTHNTDGSIKVETEDYTLAFDGRGKVTEKNKLNGTLAGGGNAVPPAAEVTPNSFGFHFDKKYNALVDGAKTTVIFYEDTSAKMFVNDALNMEIPTGMIVYSTKKIDLTAINYGIGNVSDDGKTIDIGGMLFALEEQIDISNLGKKYFVPEGMGAYFIISDDNTIHIFDNTNVKIGTITSNNVSVSGNRVSVSGNTGYDGNYEYINNKQFIINIDENNDAYVMGFDETFVCTHKKRTDLNGRYDGKNYWRNFYDKNNNSMYLSSIQHISDFDEYTLRCEFCQAELEFVRQGNYLYLYNSWMEPQKNNGELLPTLCVDIDDEEIGGWMAIPFDVAYTDGLATTINGKPVTAIYFYNNMFIPKHTKYMLTWQTIFTATEGVEPKDYSATYEGTINDFKQIKCSNYSEQTFEENLRNVSKDNNKVISLIIKCKDGELKIK